MQLPFDPERVVIVLVRPQHPGNIGSTCRAMKNMGLRHLRLVAPTDVSDERARWMASWADDVLAAAQIFPDLDGALADIGSVVGTTARDRYQRFPILTARELPPYIFPKLASGKVAILFGQEDFGLDNEAMGRCEALIRIPTADLASLNLAQAVLVVCYELLMAEPPALERVEWMIAPLEERERAISTYMRLARRVDFMKARNMEMLHARMRGMVGRLNMSSVEVGLLLGLARKVFWHLEHPTVNQGIAVLPEDVGEEEI